MEIDRILRRKEVEQSTGLSRSSIYAAISAGTFPKAIKIGRRAVGWPKSHIAAWLNNRIYKVNDNEE